MGIRTDTITARLRELRVLGFSGKVPPRFWLNLEERLLSEGATYGESEQFRRDAFSGKPVDALLNKRLARMRLLTADVRQAITSLATGSPLDVAEPVAVLTEVSPAARPAVVMRPLAIAYRRHQVAREAVRKPEPVSI